MTDRQVVALAACATLGAWWAGGPHPWLGAAAVLCALALHRPWMLCAGAAVLSAGLALRAADGLDPLPPGPVVGTAVLLTDPRPEPGGRVSAEMRWRGHHVEARAEGAAGKALLERLAGEQVGLSGRVERSPPSTPWRRSRHLVGRIVIERVDGWRPGSPAHRLANGVRRFLDRGARSVPERPRAVLFGFVLGDDRHQPPELVDDFRGSGLSHLLVVSGQNVAFVLLVASPLLGRVAYRPRLLLTLAVIVAFALATRLEPSVLRASAMAGVAAAAAAAGREASGWRCLSLAVTGLVLVDPLLVHSLGFRLSVAASVGILGLSRPLARSLPGPRLLAEAAGVTVAAQLAVAPLLIGAFGGVPMAALPANLLAAPVAGVIMTWGLVGGLVAGAAAVWGGGAGEVIAAALHLPTRLLVGWVTAVAHAGARLPLGEVGWAGLAAMGVGLGAMMAAARTGAAVGTVRAAGCALTLVSVVAVGGAARGRPPMVAEVAEGAVLWRTAGSAVLVVDRPVDARRLLDGLRRSGAGGLDVIAVRPADPRTREAVGAVVRGRSVGLVVATDPRGIAGAQRPAGGSSITLPGLEVEIAAEAGSFRARVRPARPPPVTFAGRGAVPGRTALRHQHPQRRHGDPQPHPGLVLRRRRLLRLRRLPVQGGEAGGRRRRRARRGRGEGGARTRSDRGGRARPGRPRGGGTA